MKRKSVNSSNIDSIGYEFQSSTLEIKFSNRSAYHYYDVPENIYLELIQASSCGRYFISNIKSKYRFIKVS